ncbi:N-acetylmuramoyl-L-alanine amidase [Balneolaceae bacterium ANBcel3]|nr:N-acetylmuramoyl-L-alanine amidase [Balneolaceae bacterium ANBcel3]
MRVIKHLPNFGRFKKTPGALSLLLFLILLVLPFSLPAFSSAEATPLERVSTIERSDGLGYVVRFHMSSPPDSFYVWQPNSKLIQLALFKDGIEAEQIQVRNNNSQSFENFFFQNIEDGVGTDIYLADDVYMIADAYLDANGRHLLIGLTEASSADVHVLTDGLYPIFWDDLMEDIDTDPHVSTDKADSTSLPDDSAISEMIESAVSAMDDTLTSEAPDTVSEPSPEETTFSEALTDPIPAPPPRHAFTQLRRIVLDPGHGGRDPGAIGFRGTREKDVALAVALKVGEYIERYLPEIEVFYTREDDSFVALQERGQIANRAEADLFISIHANANANRHAHGTEIYFLGMHRSQEAFEVMKKENSAIRFETEEERSEVLTPEQLAVYELSNIGFMASSEMFAAKLDKQFSDRARRRARGVKQAGFIVLYHASMPAVLVELGYITNPQEEQFLVSEYGQSIMASAIFRTIRDYKERLDRSWNNSSSSSR